MGSLAATDGAVPDASPFRLPAAGVWTTSWQQSKQTLSRNWQDIKLRLPYEAGDLAAMVRQHGSVSHESYQPTGWCWRRACRAAMQNE